MDRPHDVCAAPPRTATQVSQTPHRHRKTPLSNTSQTVNSVITTANPHPASNGNRAGVHLIWQLHSARLAVPHTSHSNLAKRAAGYNTACHPCSTANASAAGTTAARGRVPYPGWAAEYRSWRLEAGHRGHQAPVLGVQAPHSAIMAADEHLGGASAAAVGWCHTRRCEYRLGALVLPQLGT